VGGVWPAGDVGDELPGVAPLGVEGAGTGPESRARTRTGVWKVALENGVL
jgi:hypothetical protein